MSESEHSNHIIIAAGGTGGHIFPAIATSVELQKHGFTISWLGTKSGLESKIVPKNGIEINYIEIAGLRGKSIKQFITACLKLFKALNQTRKIYKAKKPALVLGMGGFVSGPAGLIAKIMGIPLVIHEQNAVAGMTNKLLAKMAKKVMTSFPDTFPSAVNPILTGNPIRANIMNIKPLAITVDEKNRPLRILIFGGSQGAAVFHKIVPSALKQANLLPAPEVWHQVGTRFMSEAEGNYQKSDIQVRLSEFIDDMAGAYEWADFVIARAGALTVSELAAVGLGAILVPYPQAVDDHQTKNSEFLANNGAAILIQQKDFTSDWLAKQLSRLNNNRILIEDMAQAAKKQGMGDAASRVANHCLEVCRGADI